MKNDNQKEKYNRWIVKTYPNAASAYLKCDEATTKLVNTFPELKRWNNPNKVSYIYLMSDMGSVIGYFPIKGKVSSVNSKLTTTSQLLYSDTSFQDGAAGVVESADIDGSYGSNGDAVFFFLTDDTYMEWNGKYFLSDRPVKLAVRPVMIYNVKNKKKPIKNKVISKKKSKKGKWRNQ